MNFGASHYIRLLGTAELAQRSSWYQKWQVHRVARPEALAGTIHFTLTGQLYAPINPSLLENTVLLDVVAATNAANNNGTKTFFLPQVMRWERNHRCFWRSTTAGRSSFSLETIL